MVMRRDRAGAKTSHEPLDPWGETEGKNDLRWFREMVMESFVCVKVIESWWVQVLKDA